MKKLVGVNMSIINGFCENCKSPVTIHIGQAILAKEIVWNLSYTCSHCSWQIEEDGTGVLPKELRKAILETEGEWSLVILETGNSATLAIKIIREAMGLSLSEAMRLKKMMPGTIVTGTKTEIERLRSFLVAEDLKVESHLC